MKDQTSRRPFFRSKISHPANPCDHKALACACSFLLVWGHSSYNCESTALESQ